MKLLLSCLAMLLVASTAFAIDADEPLEDPELQARYEKLIEGGSYLDELRALIDCATAAPQPDVPAAGDLGWGRDDLEDILSEIDGRS